MCGRFTLSTKAQIFHDRFDIKTKIIDLQPRYNIAPGQIVPIIIREDGENMLVMAKWGLIPHWQKKDSKKYNPINARAETVDVSGMFKEPFRSKRCLVPTTGFYEWHRISTKEKIPYYLIVKDANDCFAMAGIYDIFTDVEGFETTTFTIITVPANDLVGEIHDRMPAILNPQDENLWLDPKADLEQVKHLLKSFPKDKMVKHQVSERVNSAVNEEPSLIDPV